MFLDSTHILIAAAVIPAVWLLIKVYRADRLEPEPPHLLFRLVLWGALSTLLASLCEWLGQLLLSLFFRQETLLYDLLFYFVVVGLAEEGFKYVVLRIRTWHSPEFNCQFDGVVYAVFVSLGFALWENIGYVLRYGLSTALVRAVTAVPGHACFGVFMGVWYGIAKRYDAAGYKTGAAAARILAVIVPMLLHGLYDFIATLTGNTYSLVFIAFVVIMFLAAFLVVRHTSRNDRYIL